jgi:hypothetical protein
MKPANGICSLRQLTQGAIDKLKAIEGLAVEKISDDDG